MRSHKLLLLALGLLAVPAVVFVQSDHSQAWARAEPSKRAGRSQFKLPKLFDFEAYKRLFRKSYAGPLESSRRMKLFMARALRVFISANKYMSRKSKGYLALNHMSDYTREELELMRNLVLEAAIGADKSQEREASKMMNDDGLELDDGPIDNWGEFAKLRATLEASKDKSDYKQLKRRLDELEAAEAVDGKSRERRVDATELRPPRLLPVNKLINSGAGIELPVGARAKIPRSQVESNNLNYARPQILSMGLIDQQSRVPHKRLQEQRQHFNVIEQPIRRQLKTLKEKLSRRNRSQQYEGVDGSVRHKLGEVSGLSDKVFIDQRDTNCFLPPRNQGLCGACYAFVAIAMMEYMHCMKTGQLVAFSEQYIIDCGREYLEEYIAGCDGGVTWMTPLFFHNFGLELRAHYPYRQADSACPYTEGTDLGRTGYIRTDIRCTVDFHESRWPEVLKHRPLAVDVHPSPAFAEYGGGLDGWGCGRQYGSHAMVLIGHGREDGEEYWLIRNSFGIGWGEAGHWKLAKSAGCIYAHYADSFGTDDGKRDLMRLDKNTLYDANVVQTHHIKNL